jgi:hypothetical protein
MMPESCPTPRTSGGCGFGEPTFAGTDRKEQDAPGAVVDKVQTNRQREES